jgi:Reverse transcriptase (RNA-dependent DNA polymerase)
MDDFLTILPPETETPVVMSGEHDDAVVAGDEIPTGSRRRSGRIPRPNSRYNGHFVAAMRKGVEKIKRVPDNTLSALEEAIAKAAVQGEEGLDASIKVELIKVWKVKHAVEPVLLPDDVPDGIEEYQVIDGKILAKEKVDSAGAFIRNKARIVGRGDQRDDKPEAVQDTFSPTGSQYTCTFMLNNIALNGLSYMTVDVDTAYLYAEFDGLLYMRLSPKVAQIFVDIDQDAKRFLTQNGSMYVRIKKALYGLQESAKLWYETLAKTLVDIEFRCSSYDEALFYKHVGGALVLVYVYVDDMLIAGHEDDVKMTVDGLRKSYKLQTSEMSPQTFDFLGMRVERDEKAKGQFWISQPGLINEVIAGTIETSWTPCDAKLYTEKDATLFTDVTLFRSLLMKIMYLSRTRPDVKVALGYLATRMQQPTIEDWQKLTRVVKYLNGTKHFRMKIKPVNSMQVYASADASYGPYKDGKSNSGIVVTVGYPNAPIIARSCKQKPVANSSTAAELIAFTSTLEEVLWIVNLLEELGFGQETVQIEQDNKSTMRLIETGPSSTGRTKWLNIKYFWVSEKRKEGAFETKYVESLKLLADGLTKPLGRKAFMLWRQRILNY